MRSYVASLKVIYKLLPVLQFPRRATFAKSENDLTKCRLRGGRPRASRRAVPIEFKSYANVMDNKKVNVNDKCGPRGTIRIQRSSLFRELYNPFQSPFFSFFYKRLIKVNEATCTMSPEALVWLYGFK